MRMAIDKEVEEGVGNKKSSPNLHHLIGKTEENDKEEALLG
jgi:hypothetical protein